MDSVGHRLAEFVFEAGVEERSEAHVVSALFEKGLLSREQMEACLERPHRPGEEGFDKGLGRFLFERGWLQADQFFQVLNEIEMGSASDRRLGKFRLIREIGRGGMGIVYEAEDLELRRKVALKRLQVDSLTTKSLARFHQEAVITAQLDHPNIVRVLEVGMAREKDSDRPVHFIAMAYVEGQNLQEWMRQERDLRDLVRMLAEVADAVGYAHGQGVLHRDLKPANVLVDAQGRVFLTDFGLARAERLDDRLTQSHELMGTPHYMAPEQAEGNVRRITARTDVYALGVILYEMLTGRVPFRGKSMGVLLDQIRNDEPMAPGRINRKVPRDLEIVCLKALEKEARRRYADASEFAKELRRSLAGEPIEARPEGRIRRAWRGVRRRPWMAAIVLAAAIGGTLWAGWSWKQVRNFRSGRDRAIAAFERGEWAVALEESERALGLGWDARLDRIQKESKEELEKISRERDQGREYQWLQENKVKPLLEQVKAVGLLLYVPHHDIRPDFEKLEGQLLELEPYRSHRSVRDDPELWRLLGSGWYLVGDYERAEKIFLALENQRPDDPKVLFFLGMISLVMKQQSLITYCSPSSFGTHLHRVRPPSQDSLRPAEEYFERIVRLNPNGTDWSWALAKGYSLYSKGELHQCRRLCEEQLASMEMKFGMEEFCTLLGMVDFAERKTGWREWDRRALERRPHFVWGLLMRASHEPSGAVEDCSRILKMQPRFWMAYLFRSQFRRQQGDIDGAISDLTETVRADESCIVAYVNRADCLEAKLDWDGAISDYTRALELDPLDGAILSSRGRVRVKSGDRIHGREDLMRAVEIAPRIPMVYGNRAQLLIAEGDLKAALSDYDKAIELDPALPRIYPYRGALLLLLKDRKGALEDFAKAIELDPKETTAYYNRGCLYYEEGLFKGAQDDFSKVIESDPKNPEGWYGSGKCRHKLRDWEGAIDDYSQAIRLGVQNHEVHLDRADCYIERGKPEKAFDDYETALHLHPQCHRAFLGRGQLHRDLEKWDDALRDISDAIRLDGADFRGYFLRAGAWHGKRNFEESRLDLERALNRTRAGTSEQLMIQNALQSLQKEADSKR